MADISLIIPAHNEEDLLPRCLEAVEKARQQANISLETIIVLNRCTDRTEDIAKEFGAVIVREEACNLSIIRNAGAAVATAPILVTCDADSFLHPETFVQVQQKLSSEKFVGGGAVTLPERWSIGIFFSILSILPRLIWHGVSFGLFWCRTEDFRAIGGFNENLVSVEDLDFAKRLQKHGKETGGRKFGTLLGTPLMTSCRKFDQFGDWYLFLNPAFVSRVFSGTDKEAADRFWYHTGR